MPDIGNIGQSISNMNPMKGFALTTFMNIALGIIIIGGLTYMFYRLFIKFKYPVEIFQLNPLRIFKDRGSIARKDGVQRLFLLKEKRWLNDFKVLPAKGGLFGGKEKIYLSKDESGDLRPLDVGNICFGFTREDGQFIDLKDAYVTDEQNNTMNLQEVDLKTEDGREIILDAMPRFIPQNNDVKSTFINSVMETVAKYHLPSFWQQAQVFLVIIAGFVSAVIIYIINK